MYALPKTHKKDYLATPIPTMIGPRQSKFAQYLSRLLQLGSHLYLASYVKDSFTLINLMKKFKIYDSTYTYACDIKSLFAAPLAEAIYMCAETYNHLKVTEIGLAKDSFIKRQITKSVKLFPNG